MKQTMQQTAVQRAMQTPRPIPSGVEQFDMADTEEELQRQIDETQDLLEAARIERKRKAAVMQGVVDTELMSTGQIDDMIEMAASRVDLSGYRRETVAARTKEYEDQTTRNLRGTPREYVVREIAASSVATASGATSSEPTSSVAERQAAAAALRTRQTPVIFNRELFTRYNRPGPGTTVIVASGPSSSSSAAAAATTSLETPARSQLTALGTAARPPASTVSGTTVSNPYDIYILLAEARERRRLWNNSDDIPKIQLSMEISDLILQLNKLRGRADAKTNRLVSEEYNKAKLRLITIMEMPE